MIETASDIIVALRSIIADYEEMHGLSGARIQPDKAAAVQPVPRTPAAAATTFTPEELAKQRDEFELTGKLPATSISLEDSARRAAMHGRQYFLDWYGKRSDEDRKRVQAIASEIKELYPK